MSDEKRLEFLSIIGRLKHTKRTGWVLRGVDDPETISGHMYRMAIMTFLLNDEDGLDKNRCLQLSLVHDMAESIVGDFTPKCGISALEKHEKEMKAMKDLADLAGTSGETFLELFKEFEEQNTPEAKFVKDLDRFDMILQAFEYEKKENKPHRLQEFFDSVNGKLSHPLVVSLSKELEKQRTAFGNGGDSNTQEKSE
ncbi:hypothetical protein J437_LFUL011037 [Ladona fulva]|uniref:5'-deoxynucleotidase HDDC2 n=1 Tax=Ladona fulva TaxID=123851 RepID=A0A8K0KEL4_LADFU|nr:hypothetical protein J437_LFUL011037 [Ladona fulva]